eukprot:1148011-Pelagomonas_calceolata.AAC.5
MNKNRIRTNGGRCFMLAYLEIDRSLGIKERQFKQGGSYLCIWEQPGHWAPSKEGNRLPAVWKSSPLRHGSWAMSSKSGGHEQT